jgi:superfamily II DNA or RNA helicase
VILPEIDGYRDLGFESYRSADVWLPASLLPNKEAILNSGIIVSVNKRGKEPEVISLAREEGGFLVLPRHLYKEWPVKLKDLRPTPDKFRFDDNVTCRPNQKDAWAAYSAARNGVLELACGKGKTVLTMKKVAHEGVATLVVVNNEGLLSQWVDAGKEFLGLTDDQIGIVQRKKRQWDKPYVVAMLQSLTRNMERIPEWARLKFGLIVFDECHHMAASTFVKAANHFYGDRFGLTATVEREDGLEPVYQAHLGDVFFSDLSQELDAKVIYKTSMFKFNLLSDDIRDRTGEIHWLMLMGEIAKMEKRNKLIIREVYKRYSEGRKILVLSEAKAHPPILYEMAVESKLFGNAKLGLVTQKTKGKNRVGIIRESDVTFSGFQLAREGLDAKTLDTMIFAQPHKTPGGVQQAKGRLERECAGKQPPLIVVIDDIAIGPLHGAVLTLKRVLKEIKLKAERGRR